MSAPRGAIRRLLKGVVPASALRALLQRIPPREIPWDFVDIIETDPARRVKLKISHERLAKLHPADIADIIEDLAPDEREAVFETLDEGVAAEAMEELEPRCKSRSSSRSTMTAPPTSSRKWSPTPPPISSPTWTRIERPKSWCRCSPKSARKSLNCSSSGKTPPPAA